MNIQSTMIMPDFGTMTPTEVTEFYASLDRKGKSAARTAMGEQFTAHVTAVASGEADAATITEWLQRKESLVTKSPTAEPVNYAQLVADHVATLRAAVEAFESGDLTPILPESVDTDAAEGWADLEGVAGDVSAFAKVSGRKGKRGSVGDYIESVLGDEPMTVAQLRAAWSPSEDYPKSAPSAGAVSAWLTRDSEKGAEARAELGIERVDLDGTLGAERV